MPLSWAILLLPFIALPLDAFDLISFFLPDSRSVLEPDIIMLLAEPVELYILKLLGVDKEAGMAGTEAAVDMQPVLERTKVKVDINSFKRESRGFNDTWENMKKYYIKDYKTCIM